MQSIDDKILESVRKCGRGTVFAPSRFSQYGTAVAVHKALERLTDEGRIIRVARGIYIYRATITADGVREDSKAKRIAVTGH